MAIVMAINLYVVRLVLKTLGVVDYGIYDVVAGIVVMLSSVTNVLSMSTQRFFSYAIGENKNDAVIQVYSSSIIVFAVFSILVLFLGETFGLWFLNSHLEIPDDRMNAANWVFQLTILSFIFIILQTPFSSAVVAYEEMGVYSVIGLAECFLKLFFVKSLGFIQGDRLIYYALFMMLISLLGLCFYYIYVNYKYNNCKFDRDKVFKWREILVFAGWTMFGSVASISISQVCTILVNIFFGPMVNAARAIAFQVSGALNSFTNSFLTAVRPPMIKAYAEKQYDYLNSLFLSSSKLIFYGMLIIVIPLYMDIEMILNLWLDISDSQTVLFSRLMLIYSFILVLSNPITIVMHATGYVKQYHLLVEIPTIGIMPTTYIMFKCGLPAYTTYHAMIVAIIMSHILRLWCMKKYYSHFCVTNYFSSFLLRIGVTFLIILLSLFVLQFVEISSEHIFLVHIILTIVLIPILFYFIGLDRKEKVIIKDIIITKIKKKRDYNLF